MLRTLVAQIVAPELAKHDAVRAKEGIKPPKELPSIVDAIISDWSEQNQEAQKGLAKPAN